MIVEKQPYNMDYKPEIESVKFFLWMNTFFEEDNKPAEAHFQIIDHIMSKNRKKVLQASRGLSKTTLTGVYLLLYFAYLGKKPGFGHIPYAMVISDTVSQISAMFEHLVLTVDDNDKLREHLKIVKSRRGDDPTIELINSDGKTMVIKGRGAGQKVRGVKAKGKRPSLILIDDLENDENVESKDSREKLKSWFWNALVPSVDPNGYEIIMIGTPLHEDSVLSMVTESKEWHAIKLPAADKYPVDPGEKVMSAWSDRFTVKFLNDTLNMYSDVGKRNSFFQEYMLEMVSPENRLFDLELLNYWDEDEYADKVKGLQFYISVDLAISEKDYADYTAITVVGVNRNNNWFVLHMDYGRYQPDATVQKIMKLARMYKDSTLVIEKGTLYLGIKKVLQNEMLARNTFFQIKEVTRGTSKLVVVKTLEPRLNLGKLWLPKHSYKRQVEELKHQMSMVTNSEIKAKHDDLLDTLGQLGMIDLIGSDVIDKDEGKVTEWVNPYTVDMPV